ncbi:uncharacterized protein PGTG_13548 [Puccinia graminis f. sp. tritici CRL 75-36-700-3]|uniref:Uncharacterized protein n=1 Tax=Puccinia graminis f. sp. tritici (strain CRL 75-36-700-3 / race SCCL) TaxID=418459 RepID=E3KTS5_PUCGT|nr:uncharacterized protein PGTG_13548 [Puccinia graminis f. sp. tritici CRL 75-36-700-3]EFP87762.2 hypothetical protein PGTG_13548 [Puccinia graminis f. sp. tritici CRL 75-36-700-3]
MAIITFQIAIADQAYDQDHQAVFACVQNAYEPVGERIAVCGGASKTDSNKYEMTRANTVVNDPYTHNCIGAPVLEVRCCRKNAFNFPQNPKHKFKTITVDLSATKKNDNCIEGRLEDNPLIIG